MLRLRHQQRLQNPALRSDASTSFRWIDRAAHRQPDQVQSSSVSLTLRVARIVGELGCVHRVRPDAVFDPLSSAFRVRSRGRNHSACIH